MHACLQEAEELLAVPEAAPAFAAQDWAAAFVSQRGEFDYWVDDVEGTLPDFLRGTLFRNGPGNFGALACWSSQWPWVSCSPMQEDGVPPAKVDRFCMGLPCCTQLRSDHCLSLARAQLHSLRAQKVVRRCRRAWSWQEVLVAQSVCGCCMALFCQ